MENFLDWDIHQKQLLHNGHFRLLDFYLSHEKYDGGKTPVLHRELVQRSNAVAMVAYDPDQDKIVLIEQFRVGAISEKQPWLIEIVAGLIEEGESPEQVTIREAQEEIGCTPSELVKIAGFYTSPGESTEWVDLYIGRVSVSELATTAGLDHEGEDIKVIVVPATKVPEMLLQGKIRSAIAIIGLQWFEMNKDAIRQQWCTS